jgi:hypothetical protein
MNPTYCVLEAKCAVRFSRKGPDHGIAMKFGISEPTGFVSLDPVGHIDLEKCTITIYTVTTNMAFFDIIVWNE